MESPGSGVLLVHTTSEYIGIYKLYIYIYITYIYIIGVYIGIYNFRIGTVF